MDKTNLTQREAPEDDSDVYVNPYPDAYCYMCTARVEYCRCEPGEGANNLGTSSLDLVDSDLLECVKYTELRRTSTEFAQVGGVRDF